MAGAQTVAKTGASAPLSITKERPLVKKLLPKRVSDLSASNLRSWRNSQSVGKVFGRSRRKLRKTQAQSSKAEAKPKAKPKTKTEYETDEFDEDGAGGEEVGTEGSTVTQRLKKTGGELIGGVKKLGELVDKRTSQLTEVLERRMSHLSEVSESIGARGRSLSKALRKERSHSVVTEAERDMEERMKEQSLVEEIEIRRKTGFNPEEFEVSSVQSLDEHEESVRESARFAEKALRDRLREQAELEEKQKKLRKERHMAKQRYLQSKGWLKQDMRIDLAAVSMRVGGCLSSG